jgi:hypothetical protein
LKPIVCRIPKRPFPVPSRSQRNRHFNLANPLYRIFDRRQPLIELLPMKLLPLRACRQDARERFMHELRVDFRNARFLNGTANYANLL